MPTTGTVQTGAFASTTAATLSVTVASGANLALYAAIAQWDSGTNLGLSGVTYNGTAMTLVGTRSQAFATIEVWRLLNPPVGTANLIASAGTAKTMVIAALPMTAVNQTTSEGTVVNNGTAFSSSASNLTPASAVGDLVLSCMAWADGTTITMTKGASETQDANLNNPTGTGSALQGLAVSEIAGAAGTTSVTWTPSGGTVYAHVAFAVKAVAGGGSSILPLIPPRGRVGGFGF